MHDHSHATAREHSSARIHHLLLPDDPPEPPDLLVELLDLLDEFFELLDLFDPPLEDEFDDEDVEEEDSDDLLDCDDEEESFFESLDEFDDFDVFCVVPGFIPIPFIVPGFIPIPFIAFCIHFCMSAMLIAFTGSVPDPPPFDDPPLLLDPLSLVAVVVVVVDVLVVVSVLVDGWASANEAEPSVTRASVVKRSERIRASSLHPIPQPQTESASRQMRVNFLAVANSGIESARKNGICS